MEDNLTTDRIFALQNEWAKNPPLALMVKAFLGFNGSGKEKMNRNAAALVEMLERSDVEE